MKHIMCVRLTRWSIDRLRRNRVKPQPSPGVPGEGAKHCGHSLLKSPPLVLIEEVASRQVVVVACDEARSRGVRAGMTLAEARALCPGLGHAPHRPDLDAKALAALARWMMRRFSPRVAIEGADALLLDVTGSQRLFGGFDVLLQRVAQGLTGLGLAHRLCIAPTPGAAWAWASFGKDNLYIATIEDARNVLAPLPTAALRIERELVEAFHALGVETIGQLMRLPRAALPARFGSAVLDRLDQAFGCLSEPLRPILHEEPIQARVEFDGVVESLDVIWMVLERLLDQTLDELRRRGCGVRKLSIDVVLPNRLPTITRTIQLSRATCDRTSLLNLLRCATEQIKNDEGFAGLGLAVPLFERLAAEQLDLFGSTERAVESEFDGLIDRLKVRMGSGAVLVARLAESHMPEKAHLYAEAGCCNNQGNRGDGSERRASRSRPRSRSASLLTTEVVHHPASRARPLHLLEMPVEVRCIASPAADGDDDDQRSPGGAPASFIHDGAVFQVAIARGPERIAGCWWEGRHKTRDYFDVEDATGRRFWIFRVAETRKWYLHGIFDC